MKDGLQGVGGWPSEAAGKAIGCGGGATWMLRVHRADGRVFWRQG